MVPLANRHIPVTGQCSICKTGYEDSQHCLFTCKRAKDIWKDLGLETEVLQAVAEDRSGASTLATLLEHQVSKNDLFVAELAAVASWYI